jgi:Zn-dependent M28 family amino/carboxypeptidase
MLFSILIGGAFTSMLLSTLLYLSGAVFAWEWVRWVGLLAAAMEIFALSMTLHADLTPFSPGANDDASGIGVSLAMAEQLRSQPLQHTQVWLAFTGCEEAASYGILAFIRRHNEDLGRDAVYIVNDQVALGQLSFIKSDGLIKRYKAHPEALALARQTKHELLHLSIIEANGNANTDATPATKHGCKAITIVANPPKGSKVSTHWHQMSDTLENVDERTLQDAFTFTGQLLHLIDRTATGPIHPSPLEESMSS